MSHPPTVRKKDIAIIGMSGKFPKSENIEVLWEHLVQGDELIHHYTDDELRELGVPETLLDNKQYVKANSMIDHPEYFDHAFFGYTREEAEIMDPQIRIMHQQVWLALENAGYIPQQYPNKIGLFLSASDNLNWRAQTLLNPSPVISPFMSARLSDKNFISTLISYNLHLRGPSYYSSTACSSSLTAVHIACRNLLMKECTLAVAGAASIITNTSRGYLYEEDMIFSVDGRSRVFDKDSTGTLFGEGAAVVVLKKLDEAIRDQDHIYAVIRGTAVNNDGNSKVGYTAPSVSGQADCIRLAHQFADVAPRAIQFVEAHGTATKLGDPIEVEALNQAFNYDTTHPCYLGSIKSNMGHLDTVAGVAGLIKATLALKNRVLPPSINFRTPNPEINFAEGPFRVNTSSIPLQREGEDPIKAGVSSFGIGGTNAHAVLQEWPEVDVATPPSATGQLLVFSAKSRSALERYRQHFLRFLRHQQEVSWPALAYTLQAHRAQFEYRTSLVCKDKEDAIEQLEKTPVFHYNAANPQKNVFMFAGGGVQYYRMGYDLYKSESAFRAIMDEGFAWLLRETGEDFKQIMGYGADGTADTKKINGIYYMLPTIFLVEYALARLLQRAGVEPFCLIGHSLGEYTAAAISGVFSFEDALYLVLQRGALTATLPPGGMLGIELSEDEVSPYLAGTGISIATLNTEDACVVSGPVADIEALVTVLEAQQISFTRVKISIAAHSSMLDSILDDYRKALARVAFSKPQIPFISNLSGREITEAEATSIDYWVRHLRHTVNFLAGISYLLDKGAGNFIEIGSGGILGSFLKSNSHYIADKHFSVNLLKHPKEIEDDHQYYLKGLGKLWQHGTRLDWVNFQEPANRQKMVLPGYAFDETVLPVRVDPLKQMKAEGISLDVLLERESLGGYLSNWKKAVIQPNGGEHSSSQTFLWLSHENQLADQVKEQLSVGNRMVEVKWASRYREEDGYYELDPQQGVHFERLFTQLAEKDIAIQQVVYFDAACAEDRLLQSSIPLMHLCQQVIIHQLENVQKFTLLSSGSVRQNQLETPEISQQMARVTVGMILKNNSDIFCNFIDLPPGRPHPWSSQLLKEELLHNFSHEQVVYRGRERWIPFAERISPSQASPSYAYADSGTYVIINALEPYARGMVEQCIKHFPRIVLTGADNPQSDLTEEKLAAFHQLKSPGYSLKYYECNTNKETDFQKAIQAIEATAGKINGVVYLPTEAKAADNSELQQLISAQYQKFVPIDHLRAIFEPRDLDFLWIPLHLSSLEFQLTDHTYLEAYIRAMAQQLDDHTSPWTCLFWDDTGSQPSDNMDIISFFELATSRHIDTLLISSRNPNQARRQPGQVNGESPAEKESVTWEELGENYVAPQSQLEKELCELWQSFLGYGILGTEDNFFELGGNSLKAVTLLKRIQQKHNIQISLKDFYAKPTVRLLAQEIEIAHLLKSQKEKLDSKTLKI